MYKKRYQSPLGNLILISDGTYLTSLYFGDIEEEKEDPNLEVFDEVIKWLDLYFKGEIPKPLPRYKIQQVTSFTKEVLEEVEKIPYGKTVTYKEISRTIAKKRGLKKMSNQAVGSAIGKNPLCIIIPCHRVIGANDNLTGYRFGIKKKKELLKLEGNDIVHFIK